MQSVRKDKYITRRIKFLESYISMKMRTLQMKSTVETCPHYLFLRLKKDQYTTHRPDSLKVFSHTLLTFGRFYLEYK